MEGKDWQAFKSQNKKKFFFPKECKKKGEKK